MAAQFDKPRPGDVITSELMGSILDRLAELERRVESVERGAAGGGGGQIITGFDPAAQQEVGRRLTIFGRFTFPPTSNTVRVDGAPVTEFLEGSSDSRLVVMIPSSIFVAPGSAGKSARVSVSNRLGQAERSYLLLPAVESSVPDPVITSVARPDTGITILLTGRAARIVGSNFADVPAQNVISIAFTKGRDEITYPKPGGPPITITPSVTTKTQIEFTMPDITEVDAGVTQSGLLEVHVGTAESRPYPITFGRP